jgi:hypothetical protein
MKISLLIQLLLLKYIISIQEYHLNIKLNSLNSMLNASFLKEANALFFKDSLSGAVVSVNSMTCNESENQGHHMCTLVFGDKFYLNKQTREFLDRLGVPYLTVSDIDGVGSLLHSKNILLKALQVDAVGSYDNMIKEVIVLLLGKEAKGELLDSELMSVFGEKLDGKIYPRDVKLKLKKF